MEKTKYVQDMNLAEVSDAIAAVIAAVVKAPDGRTDLAAQAAWKQHLPRRPKGVKKLAPSVAP